MFCTRCGTPAADEARFCEKCGSPFDAPAQQIPPVQQPPQEPPQAPPIQDYPQPYAPVQQFPQPQERKSNKAVIIVSCVVAAALVIGGILLFAFRDNIYGTPDGDKPGVVIDGDCDDDFEPGTDVERFDALCDELFAEWVSEDTITMNYFLANPEAMGIERPEPTYGPVFTPEVWLSERAETASLLETLAGIDYNSLDAERQMIYDILKRNLEISEILEEEEDYSYYTGYVRPLTGIQVQLPILLAEFNFYTAADIDTYLELLEDTIRYFDDIIAFEKERAVRGFFMSDSNLDNVIEQLEGFVKEREDNLLITVIDEKIDNYPGLSDAQREEYKERNRELVLENVLVAYDNLLEAMISLRGVGAVEGGMATLPDGEKVAHATLRLSAGTDMTVPEVEALINKWRETALARVRGVLFTDSIIMEKYENEEAGQIPGATPEEYLLQLQKAIEEDFSSIGDINYSVQEVHESLREHLSPAFFLVPAVDRFNDNVIYINPGESGDELDDNLTLFTILAHEGYPGHLYEMVRFRQQSPHPIRHVMSNNGYTEGWATYAEYFSYDYAPLSDTEADFMRDLNLYFLLLQSHADIGVNLLGWDKEDVADLLYNDLGITEEETIDAYYDTVTGVPFNISMYSLGYIEISLMREDARNAWGDSFSYLDFHDRFLDIGPAPFELIRERLLG